MSTFPNVPNLPGVPPLLRNTLSTVSTVQGLVAGANTIRQFFAGSPAKPLWGIFNLQNQSVVDADSFLSFDNTNERNVPDFAVQGGSFASYNKVKLPSRTGVRISKGGTLGDRQALIRQLDALLDSLDTFIVLTPEKSYLSVNMERYTLDRRDKDAAFFFTDVQLYFREIQQVDVVFTNTDSSTMNAQAPSAQPPVNNGVIQPVASDTSIQSTVDSIMAQGFQ